MDKALIKTKAGMGIGYVAPQRIRPLDLGDKLDLFMRVKDIYRDAELVIKYDDVLIKKIEKAYMAPGEMEHIVIDTNTLKGNNIAVISISVEDRGG